MDIQTKTFGTLLQKAFDKSCKYIGSVGKRLAFEFETAVTFAVAAVFATGDVGHVNKILPLLKIARLEAMFKRTIVAFEIIPFAYDSVLAQYPGKINVGRCAALKVEINGVPQWETLLRAALDGEKPENKPDRAFNLDSRMANLYKIAREHGKTDTELAYAQREAKKIHPYIVPEDSTFLSSDDQQRVKDNKKLLTKKVAVAKAA